MIQNSQQNEIGLHIHVLSFFLPEYILNDNDTVLITIICLPEKSKHKFILHKTNMYLSNCVFSLNISRQTKKIIFDFKKQNFLSNNSTFAFSIINQTFDQFNSDPISTDTKVLNIYASIHQQEEQKEEQDDQESLENHTYRKVIGNMKVQLSFAETLIDTEQDNNAKDNNKTDENKFLNHEIDYVWLKNISKNANLIRYFLLLIEF